MKVHVHHENSDAMIYASVQMCAAVYKEFRKHLGADEEADSDPEVIRFRYGARMVKQGYGWYRIVVFRTFRGKDKVNFAIKLLRDWYGNYCANRNQTIRALLLAGQDAAARLAVAIQKPQAPAPSEVPPWKINKLLRKFEKPKQGKHR